MCVRGTMLRPVRMLTALSTSRMCTRLSRSAVATPMWTAAPARSLHVRAAVPLHAKSITPVRTVARTASMPVRNMLRLYSNASFSGPEKLVFPPTTSKVVAYHLLASAALVFLIIIVGGITRLTESGLSITEWNPGLKGMRLPQTDEEWNAEWDKYKQSPEFKMLNSNMTLEDFKSIFMWEWSHRILGRFIGAFFVLPAALFCLRRGMVTPDTKKKLLLIATGIGFQGFLGWFMVASGLQNPYENEPLTSQPRPDWTPRVDHFRLAAHLGTAFAVYMGMVYTAISILRDNAIVKQMKASPDQQDAIVSKFLNSLTNPAARKFRMVAMGMLALAFTTAMYGAFVAGLDAGLVYSEFPFMGEKRLLPPKDELLDPRYSVRTSDGSTPSSSYMVMGNVTQNPVTVQAIHRYLGLTTLTAAFLFMRYASRNKLQLPPAASRFAKGAAHMSATQALLGIATLIYMVPISLASLHQGGAVVVLTMLTGVLAVTRKPSQAINAFGHACRQAASLRT